jgi:hypothetical protein
MPRVIIKLKPEGNQVHVDVDGQGFQGKACDAALDRYVKAAGGDPNAAATEHKAEYAMETSQQTMR